MFCYFILARMTTSEDSHFQLEPTPEFFQKCLMKLKIIVTSIGLFVQLTASFVQLTVSFAAAACGGWRRKQSAVVEKIRKILVTPSAHSLSSRFSFPAVIGSVSHHKNAFDSILQVLFKPMGCSQSKWFNKKLCEEPDPQPEKCVHVDILHDPSPNEIRADVIFIHGLHGSLFNTWKQGLWSHRKLVQNLPLEHKYSVEENLEIRPTESLSENPESFVIKEMLKKENFKQSSENLDPILENITDLLNNIDDKIKESKIGPAATEKKEKDPYSACWPRDWLPKDCPGVRVIAVNYTTDPFLWRPVWISKRLRSSMSQRSRQMEEILLEKGVGERPIVWVGHSKGGLFVKQMLVDSKNSKDRKLARFLKQSKGIMFYSVPHRGSSLAHWNLPLLRQSIELTEVKKDCQEVLDLHQKFIKLYEEKSLNAEVFSFVETILTFMFVTNVRVVSVDSADLGLGSFQGVNIDHREICKPLNRDCFLYKELTNLIDRVV